MYPCVELEDSAVLEERGEGSELKLEAGDFGRFHEEPMDYAGVDPLTLDFDAGRGVYFSVPPQKKIKIKINTGPRRIGDNMSIFIKGRGGREK